MNEKLCENIKIFNSRVVYSCKGWKTVMNCHGCLKFRSNPLLCVVQESPAQVGWSSLLVIQNVPHSSNGSSEVQKLVRRFGTVIRSLVLHTMVNYSLMQSCYTVCPLICVSLLVKCLFYMFRSSVKWRLQPWRCLSTNASKPFHVSSRTTHCVFHAKRTPKSAHRAKSSLYPSQRSVTHIVDCNWSMKMHIWKKRVKKRFDSSKWPFAMSLCGPSHACPYWLDLGQLKQPNKPKISILDSPDQSADVHWFNVYGLCFLARTNLFCLLLFSSSGVLVAIWPQRPDSS